MATEAAGKRTRKDAKEPERVPEKKSKIEDDSQDDFGLSSLTKEVKTAIDAAIVKAGNENSNLRKCVETTRQEREKIVAEYESFKEKLDRKIEQQRRKDKTEYANLQKLCTEKLREAEEILSKQKREAKSISVLRKSLGTILEDSAEGFEDIDFEE
ncbi:hypothetical protein KFL_000340400 [Klebsormidium nitens]|uniref:Uncharacterized protein n=1 Tax=Klebsormidium nitens TaxID=105231 RepID=A0A1Y1HUV9_KLENI|nr:hypothetical protein KFL_000340400 [Klebsormidium nitens]|eukprot:GAQ79638.1 hypothetical protein KFL_000340400 [Klebsormidium nitens]